MKPGKVKKPYRGAAAAAAVRARITKEVVVCIVGKEDKSMN
jgi:hypothetical protein